MKDEGVQKPEIGNYQFVQYQSNVNTKAISSTLIFKYIAEQRKDSQRILLGFFILGILITRNFDTMDFDSRDFDSGDFVCRENDTPKGHCYCDMRLDTKSS